MTTIDRTGQTITVGPLGRQQSRALQPSNGHAANGLIHAERRARGLGWFSIGLGLAQVVTPGGLSRLARASPTAQAQDHVRRRAAGIAAGVGILARPRPGGSGRGWRATWRIWPCWASPWARGATAPPGGGRPGRGAGDGGPGPHHRARPARRSRQDRGRAWPSRPSPSTGAREEVYRSGATSETCLASWTNVESVEAGSAAVALAGPRAGRPREWDAELPTTPDESIGWRTLPRLRSRTQGRCVSSPRPAGAARRCG